MLALHRTNADAAFRDLLIVYKAKRLFFKILSIVIMAHMEIYPVLTVEGNVMANELNERLNDALRENAELTRKLQMAETENGSLKSEFLALTEKLDDANNEIARLGMVLKHRTKDIESVSRPGKQIDWSSLAGSHH